MPLQYLVLGQDRLQPVQVGVLDSPVLDPARAGAGRGSRRLRRERLCCGFTVRAHFDGDYGR
jgi:hypothetical protein